VQYNFGDQLDYKDKKRILILGAGCSLDLFWHSDEQNLFTDTESIIIATNGIISLTIPDIQVCGDPHAIKYWSKHKNNARSVLWMSRQKVISEFRRHKLNFLCSVDIMTRKYTGTGAEAFNIAYYIWYNNKSISDIYYSGFDFSDIQIKTHKNTYNNNEAIGAVKARQIRMKAQSRYCYASCSEVMPYQESIHAPDKWWDKQYLCLRTFNPCYGAQMKSLSNFKMDTKFLKVLRCRSVLNVNFLNKNKPDYNYKVATQKGILSGS